MLDLNSMEKRISSQRNTTRDNLIAARKSVTSLENEIESLDRIVAALTGRRVGTRRGRRGGKWRPGRPGRPPKWFVEQRRARAQGKAGKKTAKKAPGARPAKRKRKVSPKVLAALAKARTAMAAKRAAATTAAR